MWVGIWHLFDNNYVKYHGSSVFHPRAFGKGCEHFEKSSFHVWKQSHAFAISRKQRVHLVCVFKQLFLIFKQYFTYFNIFFHIHIFSQIFLNNNFQFLNICTKWTLKNGNKSGYGDVQLCTQLTHVVSCGQWRGGGSLLYQP